MTLLTLEELNLPEYSSTVQPTGDEEVTGVFDAASALVQAEGTAWNLGMWLSTIGQFPPEKGYEALDHIQGYEGYADDLADVRSPLEMAYRQSAIDYRRNLNEQYAKADGWGKAAGVGALIGSDIFMLAPMAGLIKGAKTAGDIFTTGVKTSAVFAAMEAGNEAVLQANQIERPASESFRNIGTSALLGALLGSGASYLTSSEFKGLSKKLEFDLESLRQPKSGESTASAMQAGTTLEQEEIKGLTRMKAVLDKMPKFLQNPLFSMATSDSLAVRKISEKLGDLSLVKNKNTAFIASEASVETHAKAADTYIQHLHDIERMTWKKYKQRIAKDGLSDSDIRGSGKNGALTRAEFNDLVWNAGTNLDKISVPEIEEYSKLLRKHVVTPIGKRAEQAGLFKNFDEMQVETAPSFMPRRHDVEKIKGNHWGYKKIVLEDLKEQRDWAAAEIDGVSKKLEAAKTALKSKRTEMRANISAAKSAAYKESFSVAKGELKQSILPDEYGKIFIEKEKSKASATSLSSNDIKSIVKSETKKAMETVYRDTIKKNIDDVEEQIRNDVFDKIQKEADNLGLNLEGNANSLFNEIFGQEGNLLGDVDISFEAFSKQIESEVMQSLDEFLSKRVSKSKELLDMDKTKFSEMINGKLKSFIERKAKLAGNAASREAEKQIIENFKDELKAHIKNVDELKKSLGGLKLKSSTLDEELDSISEELIDRVANKTHGRLAYDYETETGGTGKQMGVRGSAKARVWKIKDAKIADYVVKDPRVLIPEYARTLLTDAAINEKFGTFDFKVISKQIEDDYIILRNAKVKDAKTGELRNLTEKEVKKLDARMKNDIQNAQGVWERLRGVYRQPDDYASLGNTIARTAVAYNYVTKLGGVVASSIGDIIRPMMVNGFGKSYGALLKAAFKDIDALKMSAQEMKELGAILDLSSAGTAFSRNGLEDWTPMSSKIDRISHKTTVAASTLFGINHWNALMKTVAGVSTQNRMLKGIVEYANTGKLGVKEIENLASHGIGRDMAERIAVQYKKFGQQRDGISIANASEWDDVAARETFRMAVRKQIDEIIITPGQDKPLWMSTPVGRVIGQFKSFAFSSTYRVTLAGLQQNDARAYIGMIQMILMGSLTYKLKMAIAGKETSDSPAVWVAEGIDRSGVLGMFMEGNNIMEKMTAGKVGISGLTGGHQMSRFASRNAFSALLGPSYDLGTKMALLSNSAFSGDWREFDTHTARTLLPFNNIPYLKSLFDATENAVNDQLGVRR